MKTFLFVFYVLLTHCRFVCHCNDNFLSFFLSPSFLYAFFKAALCSCTSQTVALGSTRTAFPNMHCGWRTALSRPYLNTPRRTLSSASATQWEMRSSSRWERQTGALPYKTKQGKGSILLKHINAETTVVCQRRDYIGLQVSRSPIETKMDENKRRPNFPWGVSVYMTFSRVWEISQSSVHVFVLCLTCLKATLSYHDSDPPQWSLCNIKMCLFICMAAVHSDIQSMNEKISHKMMMRL